MVNIPWNINSRQFSTNFSKITRKEEIMQLGGGVARNKINATDRLLELRLVFEIFSLKVNGL